MSDERDEARRFSAPDDATQADKPDDATMADRPGGSSNQPHSAGSAGAFGAVGGAGADQTRPLSRTPDDPTVAAPRASRPDQTSVMPPVDDWASDRAHAPWSGRAEVRAPRPGQAGYQEIDWAPGPAEPRDRWWMPIVIGILVLLLLAALGFGVYLIVQKTRNNEAPGPVITTSAAPAPTTAPTTAPSSPPTTSAAPTPSTVEPTTAVAIPALAGLSLSDAQAALASVGLRAHVIHQADDAAADTVIESDPKEGQEVPPDTIVTLVVATPGTNTPTASSAAGAGGD